MTYAITPLRAAAVAVLAMASSLSAQTPGIIQSDALASFRYGIMCFYDDNAGPAPLSFERVNQIFEGDGYFDEVRLEPTLEVPALPNMVIGVVSSLPEGVTREVTSTITHTQPNGREFPDQAPLVFDSTLEIDSWIFDASAPVNQGTFRFLVEAGKDVLYDLTFTVVPAQSYTGVVPACLNAG